MHTRIDNTKGKCARGGFEFPFPSMQASLRCDKAEGIYAAHHEERRGNCSVRARLSSAGIRVFTVEEVLISAGHYFIIITVSYSSARDVETFF